jgi:hypothetical protein
MKTKSSHASAEDGVCALAFPAAATATVQQNCVGVSSLLIAETDMWMDGGVMVCDLDLVASRRD